MYLEKIINRYKPKPNRHRNPNSRIKREKWFYIRKRKVAQTTSALKHFSKLFHHPHFGGILDRVLTYVETKPSGNTLTLI